jgi:hypothetical protein
MAATDDSCRMIHWYAGSRTSWSQRLWIPAGVFGNSEQLAFANTNTPALSDKFPLKYSKQIHDLFAEFNLLNPRVMAALCITGGASWEFNKLVNSLTAERVRFSRPSIPSAIPAPAFEGMEAILELGDYNFLLSLYTKNTKTNEYQLQQQVDQLYHDDKLRLSYIFISTSQAWGSSVTFSGIAPSETYFVVWGPENPWLPFSLSWQIDYFPYLSVSPQVQYPERFILDQFSLGDINLEPNDVVATNRQQYSNFIFLSPHATENFQEQMQKFISMHQGDPLNPELKEIINSLKDFPPVLSQALSGLNAAMLMREEFLQLEVKDPLISSFMSFTNDTVRPAVANMNQMAPAPGNYYNPIRAGAMRVSSITISDVFGRNVTMQPGKVIIASDLQSKGLLPNFAFLSPRVVQPARLQFRWLSAGEETVEMNTHPATTPICGWLIANNLEYSLWIYSNDCKPLGSIILTENGERVMWQSVPGTDGPIQDYFGPDSAVNVELKNLVLALYNDADPTYLKAFMHANDITFSLVQPENYKQLGSTAVLMGAPIAVAQVNLDMELGELPACNQSWEALANEANNRAPKTDNGFTKVKFPVRLGAMEQVNDGLLGYFKQGDYDHYFALALDKDTPSDKVTKPDDNAIVLTPDPAGSSQKLTVLFDPRGSIHATCGILPVKEIALPPDMFADDLRKLEMTFLTTPVITNASKLAFPVPAEGGGNWTWIENELGKWSNPVEISHVDDRANLLDTPQVIKEGWMKLNFTDK